LERFVSSRPKVLARPGYDLTLRPPKSVSILWALADDQASQVAAITSNRPSNLRDLANAADFVIISHRDFLESVKPLQSLRESQGLSVAVVDVEDVYDEFGYGDKSPQAVKDFLAAGAAKRLHLERLPGDAPDRNPDEGLGNYLKRVELGNVCCADLADLRHRLRRAAVRMRHKPDIIRACSRQCGYLL
jgi:hypothetical protein